MSILYIMIVLLSGQVKVGYDVVPVAACEAVAEKFATVTVEDTDVQSVSVACVPQGNVA